MVTILRFPVIIYSGLDRGRQVKEEAEEEDVVGRKREGETYDFQHVLIRSCKFAANIRYTHEVCKQTYSWRTSAPLSYTLMRNVDY